MWYDAHIHNKHHEDGGFIIGLEGSPFFEGTLNNTEAMALHCPEKMYISFYYVIKKECGKIIEHKYLKFHPRREKYTPEEVIQSIKLNMPKAVIIDTLNEPYWIPYDYWRIAKEFSDIPFVFAHAGGYLINDFIKICHFQSNVWIDFALTHTTLGHLGDLENGLAYINQAIKYSLHSSFNDRILMSSDYPFFNQDDVFEYYLQSHELLNQNFVKLFEKIK
jgi:hypothetical protein